MPHLSVLLLSVFIFFSVTLACTPPHTQSGLSRWSDASTWPGGTLPAAGSKIDIAEGLKVLYDLDQSPIYSEINVYGTLIFDEKTTPIELRTENIYIHDGGLLQIGGECCFYNGKAIITLYQPADTTYNPYMVGTKVLGVLAGGSLELFGKIPDPTWTVLAADVNKGDTEITLATDVEGWWNVNDTIVLATTDFNVDQNEERKIVSIAGATLTLDSPLTYSHSGAIYGYADERGEVAVLDRKILIRGDNSSDANNKFGGHVMAIKDFNHVYVQGVEFTKAGQYNKKGRYPIHFHMCGDVLDRAYVKDCSFHHNFQRSITIHGTHHLIVRRNVAYDTLGHSYFIEDGIETGNELSWNLGIRSRPVANTEVILANGLVQGGILLSDDEPAIFWITNPNNTIRNNVAVGATFGFWGAFPVNPTGPSATFSVYPRRTPLLEFAYNKAHSMNSDGLFVDRGPDNSSDPVGGGYTPLNDPTNSSSGAKEAIFSTFTAYKCRNRGAWLRGGLVKVENSVFADNAIGVTFAINSYTGIIEDSVFYGETDNLGNPPNYETKGPDGRSLPKPYSGNSSLLWPIRGIEYYDGPVSFNNCHFYKFFNIPTIAGTRVCSGMSMLREDQFSISPSNDANQMAFYDESGNQIQHVYFPDYKHDGDFAVAFVDLDGSVTGRPPSNGNRAAVINKNRVLYTPNCDNSLLSTWNAYVCPDHFGSLGIRYYGISTMPDPANGQTEWIKLYREDLGSSNVYGVCGGACPPVAGMDTSFFATVVKNRGWLYHFTQPSTTFVPNDLEVNLQYTDKGDFVIVGFCYPTGTTITSISYNYKNQNLTAYATNRAALDNAPDNNDDYAKRGSGLWTRQDGNGYIWVKMYPFAARDSTNYRNAYPAAQFRLKVTLGGGSPSCAINTRSPVVAEKALPPKGSVPSPAAFDTPTYAFVDRTANEQCDAFQQGSSASTLSPAFWLSLLW